MTRPRPAVPHRPSVLLLAATAWLTVAVDPSSGAAGPPVGRKCAFNSVTDVTTEPGVQTGQINGGPLVSTDGTPGTIVCTVRVNSWSHQGPGGYSVAGNRGVATVVPPTPFSYHATAADTVTVCTEYHNGTTWYWTGGSLPTDGYWSTSSSQPCRSNTPHDWNGTACPVLLAVDTRVGTTLAETWQDCWPYEPII